MIRVLQIGLSHNRGGIENCIKNYYDNVDKNIVSIDFLDTYGEKIAYEDYFKSKGSKIYHTSNSKRKPIPFLRQMSVILRKNKYDIIHINMLSAANLLPVIAALINSNAVVIVHSHNSSVPSGALRKSLDLVNKWILRCLPVEKYACGILAGKWMWGNRFDTNHVIVNAVDKEKYRFDKNVRAELRKEYDVLDNELLIGFVGRLCEQKNVLFLPLLMSSLLNDSRDYKLVVIGEGELEEQLIKKNCDLNLNDKIILLGACDNVHEWYSAMDVFVLPSKFEGLPVVGIEAQASGLPCVFSDTISKEVKISDRVFFAPRDDVPLWTKTIGEICGNRQELRYKPTSTRYDIKSAARGLTETYKKLIDSNK